MAASISEWLESWMQENLTSTGSARHKADLQQQARRCATEAAAAGFSIAELKAAADGDLEEYLMRRQNAGAERNQDWTAKHRL